MKLLDKCFYDNDVYTNSEITKLLTNSYEGYINCLMNTINNIDGFKDASNYEKRKIIFDTLCDIHTFDMDNYYDKILGNFYLKNLAVFHDLDEKNAYLKSKSKDKGYSILLDQNTNISSYYSQNNDKFKKMLVDYLNEKECYSEELYNSVIKRVESGHFDAAFNVYKEIYNLVTKQVVSNGCIDSLYKELLDRNKIYSVRVICDNGNVLDHGVCLVYDEDKNCYSFDDISSYLFGLADKDKCFDYDLEGAKELGQGNRVPESSRVISEGFGFAINSNSGFITKSAEMDEWYKSFGIENDSDVFYPLPDNIKSVKESQSTK